jgi:hypothetical protein
VKPGATTTWLRTAEVLAMKLASPPYAAVSECVPAESIDVLNMAITVLFNAPVPSVVVPSRKVTVPVGMPEVLDVIVAVNVTEAPLDTEAAELTNAVVVTAGVMVSVTAAEVLPVKFALPLYLPVMECAPAASIDVVKVAIPVLFSVPTPSVVVPSRNATVPVGVPPLLATVAVHMTAVP